MARNGTDNRRVTKIHIGEKEVSLAWQQPSQADRRGDDGAKTDQYEEFTGRWPEPPLPGFKKALGALLEDVPELFEATADARPWLMARSEVRGVSIKYSEVVGATIHVVKKMSSGPAANLHSPYKTEPSPGEGGKLPTMGLSEDCVKRIRGVCREALKYLDGERAQMEISDTLGEERQHRLFPPLKDAEAWDSDTTWRRTKISSLAIDEATGRALDEADIKSLGALADYVHEHELTDIPGIGEAKADEIKKALGSHFRALKKELAGAPA